MEAQTSPVLMHPCDLCDNHEHFLDVPGDPTGKVKICGNCGFVLVRERRGIEEVARAWDDIYAKGLYSPDWPGVKARLFYVAEWLDQTIGLRDKRVLDIGAGNGFFLGQCRALGAYPSGLDPSLDNCRKIGLRGIEFFQGWAGGTPPPSLAGKFDIVTLNWTLENTADCIAVLRYARDCLRPDGHVVVATGSRILVPFKKPLSSYLGSGTPPDTHCFRWSWNTLAGTFTRSRLVPIEWNDYQENDVMIEVARQSLSDEGYLVHGRDNPDKVQDFFARWQREFP